MNASDSPPIQQSLARRMWQSRYFYLFVSPFFILFGVFGLYPLLFSLALSFYQWDGMTAPKFVGLGNFVRLAGDPGFYNALYNTVVIGLIYIPPMFAGAFLLALLLNQQFVKLRGLWRAAVFIPCITPVVVIAIVFQILLGADQGLLNYGLRHLGLGRLGWLDSAALSKVSVSMLLVWRWTGYNMVIMLAGLQSIPPSLYEAARIDGAGGWRRMIDITIPQMVPTFVFCAVMSLIGTVYMFDEPFVLTQGGPGTSSTNFGVYLFNVSFSDFRFGYASAAGYTVAVVVFVATLLLFRRGKDANA